MPLLLLRYWKPIAAGAAILLVIFASCFAFWRGMATIERMVTTAAKEASEKQDAKWQAQIEKANATVERARAEQAVKAAALEAAATAAAARAASLESELERRNNETPSDPAGGISADGNRLLNRARP